MADKDGRRDMALFIKNFKVGSAAENWTQPDGKTVLNTYSQEDTINIGKNGLSYTAIPDYGMIFKNATASAGKKMRQNCSPISFQHDGNNHSAPLEVSNE